MKTEDFIINVGPGGTFLPSGQYQSSPSDIDELFNRFELSNTKKISLYFHGGLVNEKKGIETARKMAVHLKDAGQEPICFAWETGLFETVFSNLSKISETTIFQKLIRVLIKKLSEKIGLEISSGRGFVNGFTIEEIDEELAKNDPFQYYSSTIQETISRGDYLLTEIPSDEKVFLNSLEAEYYYEVNSDTEFTNSLTQTKFTTESNTQLESRGIISIATFVKHLAKITLRVIKRFYEKRDHHFYPTVVEEILRELYIADFGSWVWDNMKTKSNQMWQSNEGKKDKHQYAGRYLLHRLIQYAESHQDLEVNLIGHSAGSIVICHLLKEIGNIKPDFAVNKIVFMAPACRADLFLAEVISKPSRYQKFRMFTMSDSIEVMDKLVPFVYTHSLLYFISGVLEEEGKAYDAYILGLERHLQAIGVYEIPLLIQIKTFLLEQNNHRLVLSKTIDGAPIGLQSHSTLHGGFDDDEATIDSIKTFIRG